MLSLTLLAALFIHALSASAATISLPRSNTHKALLKSAVAFGERIPTALSSVNHTERAIRRAEPWSATHPGLQEAIDAAVAKTASKTHYFWTGRISPGLSDDDSAMHLAMSISLARGGTTLEGTVEGVDMPGYGGKADPDSEAIWQYASDEYAAKAKGDVYVVMGEMLRSGNVWEVYEYPRLKKTSVVKRIFEIKVHRTSTELPHQIYPEVKGCDGVFFIDSEVHCPAGSSLYYGSIQKPMVTAKTTTADTKIKISRTGKASGVVPICTEIISSEFVLDLLTKSGACDAANNKGNNGVVMKQVKNLITSSSNRNYIQQRGLMKTKARVTGVPLMGTLEWMVLDSLVSLDYYTHTVAATNAMTKKIDSIVKSATGVSPGLTAAWAKQVAAQPATKAKLLQALQKQIAQKQKEAQEAQKRAGQCGAAPTNTGSGKSTTRRSLAALSDIGSRSGTFSGAFFSPLPRTSLQKRLQKASRSGPHAPAAPSCPMKKAPTKKVVPRSKTKTKAPPKKAPRSPSKKPAARKPNPKKQKVARPASRARRTPGKAAPRRRTTPKRKPKVVPRPARKPKGKARARRHR